jgi:peptidyl-prolyl cis-trans isomerase A (cyclophilin A)
MTSTLRIAVALLAAASLAAQAAPAKPAGGSAVPAVFKVKFETSKGDFVVEVHKDWAPIGAARFHRLVSQGFYDECRFFRVMPGFVVQFGINGTPSVQAKWRDAQLKDDPVKETNAPGTLTYAKTAVPNSRTTQVFINLGNNARLDADGFAPFGKIISGMEVVLTFNAEYGGAPSDAQPQIQMRGNAFLKEKFPRLDFIKKASIVAE